MPLFTRTLGSLVLLTLTLAHSCAWLGAAATRPAVPTLQRPPVFALHGVVCASNALASQAGLKVLEQGGNAFDAAVAAAAVLNVVEPMMTGIGGDVFALAWLEQEQRLVGLNASGRSGSTFTIDKLQSAGHTSIPERGGVTVTVPGALSGWAALLERHGTLSLAAVLEPAIRIADEGFLVPAVTAGQWEWMHGKLTQPAARATFSRPDGEPPRAGDWMHNPDLARTFREIAAHGPSWLYGGELGRRIAEFLEAEGGHVTLDDLAVHQPRWVEPLAATWDGRYRLWELPPNGQGVAALEMIRLLDTPEFRARPLLSTDSLHALIEAKKLAYADLAATVADPAILRMRPEELLADAFIAQRRTQIDPRRAQSHVEPDPRLLITNTTYLAVADRTGNMVSFINSICSGFGSGLVVPGTGFALQNRAVGFRMEPGHVNSVGPRQLPFHTIIPGFITEIGADGRDRPWAAFGIVGGDNQPAAHVQVFLQLIQQQLDAQQAIDAPRFRHQQGNKVVLEDRLDAARVAELADRGHEPAELKYPPGEYFGTGHVLRRLPRGYQAGSDSRGDGLPAGY